MATCNHNKKTNVVIKKNLYKWVNHNIRMHANA